MNVKLPPHFQAVLMAMPETGMGYHIVDIYLKDGTLLKSRLVFNSEELFTYEHEELTSDFELVMPVSRNINRTDEDCIFEKLIQWSIYTGVFKDYTVKDVQDWLTKNM